VIARRRLGDAVAGITVALIAVPQSMAYAELAGMPPHHGLYAVALPAVAAAFFASSAWLQTGPVATTSLLTFGALATLATPGSTDYIGLAALLALVVGATRVAIGLLRGGAVSYLMSMPVLRGFVVGAALLIFSSQVPSVLGIVPGDAGVMGNALLALQDPSAWDPWALGFAAATLVLILGGQKLHPLFPGVLVAVVLAVVGSVALGYAGPVVGEVPTGLPRLTLDLPWARLTDLLLPGVVIAVVGFAEAASISQAFAEHEGVSWDPDREFVSQGVANLASGLVGGFPVGGSFSRSAINHLAGAKTRLAGAITGIAVLAMLPAAGLLSALPRAVLGGIVIAAVRSLLKVRPLVDLWRLSPPQAVLGWATFALTLLLAPRIEWAVVAGVAGAVSLHLWREREVTLVVERRGETLWVRPMGVVWFGSAPALRRAIAAELASAPADSVVLDLSGLGRLDLSGALVLQAIVETGRARGTEFSLAAVPPRLERVVSRALPGLARTLGPAGAKGPS